MKLSNALIMIKGTTEKAASASGAPVASEKTAADSNDRLKAALKEATNPVPVSEKKAAAASPVGDLMKTASEMATAEHEALIKEAHLYGSAVCDGFMVRLSQYNEVAEKVASQQTPQKTAAVNDGPTTDQSFEKFAQENPSLVKEAVELGYASTMGQLEKLSSASYAKGYDEGVANIYKLAHSSFVSGYEDTLRLVEGLRR